MNKEKVIKVLDTSSNIGKYFLRTLGISTAAIASVPLITTLSPIAGAAILVGSITTADILYTKLLDI